MLKQIGAYVATGCVFVALLGLTAIYYCLEFILDIVDKVLELVGY